MAGRGVHERKRKPDDPRQLATLVAAIVVVLVAAFAVPASLRRDLPVAVLILPLMLWSAFRVDARSPPLSVC